MLKIKETKQCPKCESSWIGEDMFTVFKKQKENESPYWKHKSDEEIQKIIKESYSPPYYFKREIGIELAWDHPKHYDGVSYWKCPDCETYFDRFDNMKETSFNEVFNCEKST